MNQYVRQGEFRQELEMHASLIVDQFLANNSSFDCGRLLRQNGIPAGESQPLEHGTPFFETLKLVMWENLDRTGGENRSHAMDRFISASMSRADGLMFISGFREDKPHYFTWFLQKYIAQMKQKYRLNEIFEDVAARS